MAISFPNGIVKATGSGVTSVTTGSVTTTTGSTFAIGCSYGASFWGSIDSFSDSKSNTYTSTGSAITDGIKIELAYCENGTGGSGHTATVDGAGSNTDFPVVYFAELAGAATASYDSGAHAKGVDTSSPYTITSGTLAQADSAILVLASTWEGVVINQDITTGYTVIKEDDYGAYFGSAMGRKVVSSTSAETATYSTGSTANTVLGIYAFKAASTAASTINAASGVATTSTMTGASTAKSTPAAAAGVAATSTMVGSSTDQATISAAAGVATASAMAGTGITQSTITAAAGQATTSTMTGGATVQASMSAAAGVATTSTLAATAIATASFSIAQGVATTSTLFAVGASEFVAALGQATTSDMAASSTAQASFVPASGLASTSTMIGRDASAPPGTSGSTFRPTYRPRRR